MGLIARVGELRGSCGRSLRVGGGKGVARRIGAGCVSRLRGRLLEAGQKVEDIFHVYFAHLYGSSVLYLRRMGKYVRRCK